MNEQTPVKIQLIELIAKALEEKFKIPISKAKITILDEVENSDYYLIRLIE